MKKIFGLFFIIVLSLFFNSYCHAQESDLPADIGNISGAESGEIMIASGGTVMATCTGNVPFRNLTVMGGFNNIIIDPTTGNLQLNIEIEKETNKNILDFKITTAFNPDEVLSGLLLGMTIPLNDNNLMLTLSSTNKITGETIDVGNQVRRLIENEQGRSIDDTENFIPSMGSIQVRTRNNLASGFIRIAFDNTSRAIERASEVTGEDITIDENGEAALVARFENIPVNGSFQDLAGFDPDDLPRGVMLGALPTGIDFNNLPGFLETFSLPEGINFSDIVGQIPPGFNLQDVINLPAGFMVEDLADIPPFFGINPGDLGFLPQDFNLNDLINLPPGLDLGSVPTDMISDFIGVQIPEGIDFDAIVNGIINGTINPNELISTAFGGGQPDICENGVVKPTFAPFVPPGFVCPPSSISSSGGGPPNIPDGGLPGGFDINTVCENGMIKPEFQPFVPPNVTCP